MVGQLTVSNLKVEFFIAFLISIFDQSSDLNTSTGPDLKSIFLISSFFSISMPEITSIFFVLILTACLLELPNWSIATIPAKKLVFRSASAGFKNLIIPDELTLRYLESSYDESMSQFTGSLAVNTPTGPERSLYVMSKLPVFSFRNTIGASVSLISLETSKVVWIPNSVSSSLFKYFELPTSSARRKLSRVQVPDSECVPRTVWSLYVPFRKLPVEGEEKYPASRNCFPLGLRHLACEALPPLPLA